MMSGKGTSIQNVTHFLPDNFCRSDACEYGIQGYSNKGKAWQWKLPTHLRGRFSINLLEFLASVITIILSLEKSKQNTQIFALTDKSSALGWVFKASFQQKQTNITTNRELQILYKEPQKLDTQHDNVMKADFLLITFV